MNVVLNIGGRDCLAVWTLPYVTSWRLSPDMLLARLCSETDYSSEKFPTAFILTANNTPKSLLPAQWYELHNIIDKLDHDLNKSNLPKVEDRKAWKKHSIEEFWEYESAYVWLDEFERWYEQFINNYWVSEENENTELCFNPIIPKIHAKYFENEEKAKLRNRDMKPTTMLDIEAWESTRFVKLPFFLDALQFSPLTRGSDITTEVFFRLMDNGLPLRFSEPGYCFDDEKIPKGDVKCALLRIDKKLFETDSPKGKIFANEIIKTEAGNDISLASILIGRDDVSVVFAQMGFDFYPWVKVPWPISESDFCDYPAEKLEQFQTKVVGGMSDFLDKFQAKTGHSFFDEGSHNEYDSTFDVINNPELDELDRDRAKAAAQIKASRSHGNIDVDILLKQSIGELFSKKNYANDFTRYFDLYVWKQQLEKDIERRNELKATTYGEQAKRDEDIAKIRQKIQEIEWHLNDCRTETQAETTRNSVQSSLEKSPDNDTVSTQIKDNKDKITSQFKQFKDLRSHEIKMIMLENDAAEIIIRRKKIIVNPSHLNMTVKSISWKALQNAAFNNGDLTKAFSKPKNSNDLEKGRNRFTTEVSRLRKKLIGSMGLIDNPIPDNCYKLVFESINHELIGGRRTSKGDAAMHYATKLNDSISNSNQYMDDYDTGNEQDTDEDDTDRGW